MKFKQIQEQSKRNSNLLIFLFALSTIIICSLIAFTLTYFFASSKFDYARYTLTNHRESPDILTLFTATDSIPILLGIFFVVAVIIAASSASTISKFSKGGKVVAESLDGRLITRDTRNPYEKQLINIVDEVAIAANMPVPHIYILDDDGINAFAAGTSPKNAAIGITRGAMEKLTRDELQGVIAHEFSHIFNGDMNLNIKAIGLIGGLTLLYTIGYYLFRIAASTSRQPRSSNSKDGAGIALVFMLVGLLVLILGYIGVFFGNIIKAAISRQREYLADAFAVQWTRYPQGIGGALQKIHVFGAKITQANSQEFSHLYFAKGASELFATHPPLEKRIKNILPNWNGKFDNVKIRQSVPETVEVEAKHNKILPIDKVVALSALMTEEPFSEQKVQASKENLQVINKSFEAELQDTFYARFLVFAFLIQEDAVDKKMQIIEEFITEAGYNPTAKKQFMEIYRKSTHFNQKEKLDTLNIAISALKNLSRTQYFHFRKTVIALIQADNALSWYELNMKQLVLHSLDLHLNLIKNPTEKFKKLFDIKNEVELVLSIASYQAFGDEGWRRFRECIIENNLQTLNLVYRPYQKIDMYQVENAFLTLQQANYAVREELILLVIFCLTKENNQIENVFSLYAMASFLSIPLNLQK